MINPAAIGLWGYGLSYDTEIRNMLDEDFGTRPHGLTAVLSPHVPRRASAVAPSLDPRTIHLCKTRLGLSLEYPGGGTNSNDVVETPTAPFVGQKIPHPTQAPQRPRQMR